MLTLLFVLINLGDEELRSEVKQVLDWQPPEHALDKDNGFLILLGMDAPAGQDAWQVGKQHLAAEFLRYKITRQTHKEPPNESDQIIRLLDKKWERYRCDYFKEQNCVEFYIKQDAAKLNSFFTAFAPQLQRLETIKRRKYLVETVPPMITAMLPPYGSLAIPYDINRIKAVRKIANGNLEQGVSIWVENAMFSRRLLKESSSLISRMVAIAIIQRDMRILSELIAKYAEITAYRKKLLPGLASISGAEFNMVKPLIYERDYALHIVNLIPYEDKGEFFVDYGISRNYVESLIYQPNTTNNLFYDWGTLDAQLAESGPLHLNEAITWLNSKQENLLGFGLRPYYANNPIGKILIQVGGNHKAYLERQHDTDGFMRLVGLQLELAANQVVSEDGIRQVMQKYTNPYTGKPFDYDPKTKQITFIGRQPSRVNVGESKMYRITLN